MKIYIVTRLQPMDSSNPNGQLVMVNDSVWSSKEKAEKYIELAEIESNQMYNHYDYYLEEHEIDTEREFEIY